MIKKLTQVDENGCAWRDAQAIVDKVNELVDEVNKISSSIGRLSLAMTSLAQMKPDVWNEFQELVSEYKKALEALNKERD